MAHDYRFTRIPLVQSVLGLIPEKGSSFTIQVEDIHELIII